MVRASVVWVVPAGSVPVGWAPERTGGVVSVVQVKLAGVGSVFPAGSVARTWKVWLPLASAL